MSHGCIEAFCNLLVCPDPKIVMVCLQGLDNILKAGETEKELDKCGLNRYAQFIDECEGLEKIEDLQQHDNSEIYAKAVRMLERYWVEEEEEAQDAQGAIECTEPSSEFQDNQSTLTSTERL